MATEQPREGHTSDLRAEVEQRGVLPPGVRGTDAASAVLCVLAQRLSGGEARDLVESLPEGLRARVDVCAMHRGERGEVFDRAEFLRRVATHLNVTVPQAEEIARAVFAAVRRTLPSTARSWWTVAQRYSAMYAERRPSRRRSCSPSASVSA